MAKKKVKSKVRKQIEIMRLNIILGVLVGVFGSAFVTTLFRFIDLWNYTELYRLLLSIGMLFGIVYFLNRFIEKQLDIIENMK